MCVGADKSSKAVSFALGKEKISKDLNGDGKSCLSAKKEKRPHPKSVRVVKDDVSTIKEKEHAKTNG